MFAPLLQTVGVDVGEETRTTSVLPRRPVTITGVCAGTLLASSVTAGQDSPAICR
jgi:hypothetical protein